MLPAESGGRGISRAGCIGNRQTVVPVLDAKHDVFLSLAGPREAAYGELGRWLEQFSD